MIIGNGLVATAFRPYFENDPEAIIFASGVSNSCETRVEEFQREEEMLREALKHEKFTVYFSTCSLMDPELSGTPYVTHKRKMESIVRSTQDYAIFRLPQVVGDTKNKNTLTNYIYRQIECGANFRIWRHARRNLIDVDDVASIVNHFVRSGLACRLEENIASPFSISVMQLVRIFECILNKSANYTLVESGGAYEVDSSKALEIASQINITFGSDYVEKVIAKYYGY